MTEGGLIEMDLEEKTSKRVSKRLEGANFGRGSDEEPADSITNHGKRKPRSRSPSGSRSRLRFSGEESYQTNQKNGEKAVYRRRASAREKGADRKENAKQIKEKAKRKGVYKEEQKKRKSKIRFDDEIVSSSEKDKLVQEDKVAVIPVRRMVSGVLEDKEETDDNAAADAAKGAEKTTDTAYRLHSRRLAKRKRKQYDRTHKLEERSSHAKMEFSHGDAKKSYDTAKEQHARNRFIQKQRLKREYAKAYRAKKAGSETAAFGTTFMKKASRKVQSFFAEHKGMVISVVALILLLVIVMNTVTSCSVGALQALSNVMAASYLSDPQEIEKAELYYTELEANLQKQINEMESEHPGLDEYRYNIGEIGHDPHMLISYLSAKYEVFTFKQVKAEIESLFEAQYGLSAEQVTETKSETKTVKVGESLGTVKTTGYCSCTICCGVWSGGPTASGVMPKGNHTLAVDASNPIVPMGTKIVMNGVEYTVEDTGPLARNGIAFDVYFDNHTDALNHGVRMWEAYLAEGNENTVEVTTTENVDALNVTLAARSLRTVIYSRMNDEQKELYELIYSVKGNLQIYTTPIDLNWYSYIKSYYGYRINPATGKKELHRGIEISVGEGTEVKSGQTGKIVKTGYDDYYGYYVITEDEKGDRLTYGHLQSTLVTKGQSINAGDVIGKTGSTGSALGSQFYLELTKDGEYYNPIFYVDTGEGGYGGGGTGTEYDDETVQKIFEEAEKYLGMPYVWGGSSPATSFDCSGFVSYVFTNSGVCNMGRLTAQGIYNICTPVDPADAKPGDIIFFTGTYSTSDPVTHVGIYAGDGMMIHCGNPIQYTSIYSAYWTQHFYGFGRPNY